MPFCVAGLWAEAAAQPPTPPLRKRHTLRRRSITEDVGELPFSTPSCDTIANGRIWKGAGTGSPIWCHQRQAHGNRALVTKAWPRGRPRNTISTKHVILRGSRRPVELRLKPSCPAGVLVISASGSSTDANTPAHEQRAYRANAKQKLRI